MRSFSFLSYFIVFVDILLVCSQQTNTAGAGQQPINTANEGQTHQATSNNPAVIGETIIVKNPEINHPGPVVGLFSSSYRGPSHSNPNQNQQFVSSQQGFTTYSGFPHEAIPFTTNGLAVATSAQPTQLFGLSSNGDFSLSAYFGPIFWATVSSVIVIILIILLFRSLGGFERIGGLVENLRDSNKKNGGNGRAIDLDKLSTMVYTAIDQYGKWKNNPYDKTL